ncbi:phosphatidate cytidylyltransferase, partial [Cylindrospermopsis raciborskii]
MPWSRIISGIIAIVLAVSCTLLGGWYFTIAIGIIVFFGQLEYFNLVRSRGMRPAAKTTISVSLILLGICNFQPSLADAIMPIA